MSAGNLVGQPAPCGVAAHISNGNPLNGYNFVNLNFDRASFPDFAMDENGNSVDEIRSKMFESLEQGAERWNNTCDAVHNDQPVFLVSESSFNFPGILNVTVSFEPRDAAPSACTDLVPNCFPMAETHHSWTNGVGTAKIIVFGEHGDEREGPLELTFVSASGKYQRVLEHELGHLLGLDHDECFFSVMTAAGTDLLQMPMPLIKTEQCTVLNGLFEAADPIRPIHQQCSLNRYCFDSRPWPQYISICRFEKSTAQVSTYAGSQLLGIANTTYTDSYCTVQAIRSPFEWERTSSPRVLLLNPANGAVVSGPIPVEGWAWERGSGIDTVKVFVDGEPAPMVGFQHGLASSLTCPPDLDPEFCHPSSRFAGLLDTSHLTPGRHSVQVVATDWSEYPRPVVQAVEIIVNAPNHPPIATDDYAHAAVVNDVARLLVLDVLANDYDPEGSVTPIVALIAPPSKGIATIVDGRRIAYVPFPTSSGSDTFSYQIEDPFGLRAIASVHIQIFHGLFIP